LTAFGAETTDVMPLLQFLNASYNRIKTLDYFENIKLVSLQVGRHTSIFQIVYWVRN